MSTRQSFKSERIFLWVLIILVMGLITGCGLFEKTYTLNVFVNEEDGGSVHIDPQEEEYEEGAEVELTAVAEDGWYFSEWQGDAEGTETSFQIKMDGDKEVTAIFERLDYELTIDTEGEGEVEIIEVIEPQAGEYPYETVVTLEAVAEDNWYFSEWQGDLSGSENPVELVMDSGKDITAIFEINTYEVTFRVESGDGEISAKAGGSVIASGDLVEVGSEIIFTATPDEGYGVKDWIVDGESTSSMDETYTIQELDNDVDVRVKFLPVVEFEDENLEQVVRDAIDKPDGPIFLEDVEGLTELDGSGQGIERLEGIEYLAGLEVLSLNNNEISDISALSGLSSLEWLSLRNNNINEIDPLSGLTSLEWLSLRNNNISDIDALSGLTNLTELWLFSNNISEISSLSGLINLSDLYLSENNISDIDALSDLTNLTKLGLNRNNISDIDTLSVLTNLTVLDLIVNDISEIDALSVLTNLTHLYLSANDIINIDALSELTNLTVLWLDSNNISDIDALSGLNSLSRLWLHYNDIDEIDALSGLTSLMYLNLHHNNINEIDVLSGLINLRQLYIHYNNITDIGALVDNAGLTIGDKVDIRWNYLDLSAEAEDLENIKKLSDRGVEVLYDPQRE